MHIHMQIHIKKALNPYGNNTNFLATQLESIERKP